MVLLLTTVFASLSNILRKFQLMIRELKPRICSGKTFRSLVLYVGNGLLL